MYSKTKDIGTTYYCAVFFIERYKYSAMAGINIYYREVFTVEGLHYWKSHCTQYKGQVASASSFTHALLTTATLPPTTTCSYGVGCSSCVCCALALHCCSIIPLFDSFVVVLNENKCMCYWNYPLKNPSFGNVICDIIIST